MKKEFVPYELAVKLKELGFDEPCLAFYLDNDKKSFTKCMERADTNAWLKEHMKVYGDSTTAPLFQQAFRWFREKYGIYLTIEHSYYSKKWMAMYCKIDLTISPSLIFSKDTYEETELACITKLIEIVEQQNQK